jgi:formiminoglutamase
LTDQPPLDIGNVRIHGDLEESQETLGAVVAHVLQTGAVPIVLGGGHETAYGHYLGYVKAKKPVGVINIDAHLDVRPLIDGKGHSGSPFRQMLEHPDQPLRPQNYICLGAQLHTVSRAHYQYAKERGCSITWELELFAVDESLAEHVKRIAQASACSTLLTIDADAFQVADVPGVSAPNVKGLSGFTAFHCAGWAGRSPAVSSIELVEINPRFDRDGQSARWAALVIWNFLTGLAVRGTAE